MSKTEISGIKTSVFLDFYVDKLTTVKLNVNGLRSEVKKDKKSKKVLVKYKYLGYNVLRSDQKIFEV